MIFKSIGNIHTKEEKALFVELVSLYCKIVREMCALRGINYKPTAIAVTKPIADELLQMGLITNVEQIDDLQGAIKSLYTEFIYSIKVYLTHLSLFGDVLDKLSNAKRSVLQDKELKENKPKVADLFAGAGGLSLGFIQAGFKICFANDFEEVCVNTYKYNHPEIPSSRVCQEDIRHIASNIADYITEDVDVVIGGPPCQGFSSANQQRIIDDPRNELYKYFLKAVEQIAPKFVLMENVRGMLNVADQVVEDYRALNIKKCGCTYTYDVKYELLNSSAFSVAQSRDRLIYIAIRNDIMESKRISPAMIFEQIRHACKGSCTYNLSEALAFIRPLDAPRIKNTNEVDAEETGKKVDKNTYMGESNEYLSLINQGRTIPLIYNHKARYLNDINYEIYSSLEPGDDASDEKISSIMPYKHRLHCFKDKYYKLIPDKPSRTITAHLRMDCHSHIHPTQVRSITPREAARIQSFPDDYLFLGAYLKTYMQIGNAVPVLMAKQIATIIKKYLR